MSRRKQESSLKYATRKFPSTVGGSPIRVGGVAWREAGARADPMLLQWARIYGIPHLPTFEEAFRVHYVPPKMHWTPLSAFAYMLYRSDVLDVVQCV